MVSFEELCPIWSAKLKDDITKIHEVYTVNGIELAIGNPSTCIVAEPWKFDNTYEHFFANPNRCGTCEHYSMEFYRIGHLLYGEFPEIKEAKKKYNKLKRGFAKHFTNKHYKK